MADYTIVGRDDLGQVADGDTASSAKHAAQLAARLRVEGLRVTVRPPLPKPLSVEVVRHLKATIRDD